MEYDDFYDGTDLFDSELAELKASLMLSIKKEFLDRMAALEKENAALRDFRDQKAKYDAELRQMRAKYDAAIRNAKQDVARKRANEIVRSIRVSGYRPTAIYTQRQKCDKCDKNRCISYISPMGRKCTEECKCAIKDVHYEPHENQLIRFSIESNGSKHVYYNCSEERDRDIYSLCADFYPQRPDDYEGISRYGAVFLNEADCQSYCDWLNAKRKKEDNNGSIPQPD